MFLSDRSHVTVEQIKAMLVRNFQTAGLLLDVKIDNLTRNPRACSQSKVSHTFTLGLFLDLSSDRRLGDIGQASAFALQALFPTFD